MVNIGEYNVLKVIKSLTIGLILDDGKEGILLPKRFVPAGVKLGDDLKVFLYHDGELFLMVASCWFPIPSRPST